MTLTSKQVLHYNKLFNRALDNLNRYNFPEKMMIDEAIHQFESALQLEVTCSGELQLLEERLKKYLILIKNYEL